MCLCFEWIFLWEAVLWLILGNKIRPNNKDKYFSIITNPTVNTISKTINLSYDKDKKKYLDQQQVLFNYEIRIWFILARGWFSISLMIRSLYILSYRSQVSYMGFEYMLVSRSKTYKKLKKKEKQNKNRKIFDFVPANCERTIVLFLLLLFFLSPNRY